ncbi:MAG: hypothetical protein AB7F28_03670 [Candidatus Margulisiibacteriota bacterium]
MLFQKFVSLAHTEEDSEIGSPAKRVHLDTRKPSAEIQTVWIHTALANHFGLVERAQDCLRNQDTIRARIEQFYIDPARYANETMQKFLSCCQFIVDSGRLPVSSNQPTKTHSPEDQAASWLGHCLSNARTNASNTATDAVSRYLVAQLFGTHQPFFIQNRLQDLQFLSTLKYVDDCIRQHNRLPNTTEDSPVYKAYQNIFNHYPRGFPQDLQRFVDHLFPPERLLPYVRPTGDMALNKLFSALIEHFRSHGNANPYSHTKSDSELVRWWEEKFRSEGKTRKHSITSQAEAKVNRILELRKAIATLKEGDWNDQALHLAQHIGLIAPPAPAPAAAAPAAQA